MNGLRFALRCSLLSGLFGAALACSSSEPNDAVGTSGGAGADGKSLDAPACQAACAVAESQEGKDAYTQAFVAACGCQPDASCAEACAETCAGETQSTVVGVCRGCALSAGLTNACGVAAQEACRADATCRATLDCLGPCKTGTGSTDPKACRAACAETHPAGVKAYNAEVDGLSTCLCTSDACSAKCASSPICQGNGSQKAEAACLDCQSECFPACKQDVACKALLDCIAACD